MKWLTFRRRCLSYTHMIQYFGSVLHVSIMYPQCTRPTYTDCTVLGTTPCLLLHHVLYILIMYVPGVLYCRLSGVGTLLISPKNDNPGVIAQTDG